MSRRVKQTLFPPGSMLFFAKNTPPAGWLIADGSVVLAADYPELYEAIGTYYGSGGAGTFRLPEMRGQFIRGYHTASTGINGVDPDYATRTFGSVQQSANKSHDHILRFDHNHTMSNHSNPVTQPYMRPGGNGSALKTGGNGIFGTSQYPPPYVSPIVGTSPVGNTELRPRNIALLLCIKY